VNFDIRTLSIITAVSSLVFAFASMTVAHLVKSERHLRHWAAGAGLIATSTFLVGLRGLIPDLISAALANTVLTLGLSFLYLGTRGLMQRPPPGRWLWLFAVFAFFTLSWFTAIDPSLPMRIIIVSLVCVPLLTLMAFEFWRHDRTTGPTPLRSANRITVLVLVLGALIFLGRIGHALSQGNPQTYVTTNSVILVAPYLWAILMNVWLSVMVTLSVSARLQSDLVVARDRAEANSQAKGQFLANMSHEIRTPLNAVLGMLKLLQGTHLNHTQNDYTQKADGAARALLGLLTDILDFSKAEAGQLALNPRAFSMETLLRDLSVILSVSASEKSMLVRFDVDPKAPKHLMGDDIRLLQILINLCGNAIKFSNEGEVVLHLRVLEQTANDVLVEFAVQDSGIGIAPENQSHIFTGFSQAEASSTRRFDGAGLGLPISSRLVQLLGGQLQLSSELGKGSTFYFQVRMDLAENSLALSNAAAETPAPAMSSTPTPPKAEKPKRLLGMRILIVEDNKINQMVAKGLLSKEGAHITVADDGQLGVQAVTTAQPQFDVVLMDLQMPVMDGYTATRTIRQDLGLTQLPIIAMTANVLPSDRAACLEAGMVDHVGKPFELDHLVGLLLHHTGLDT
jgi:signal transduction histidine kinase/ActR/RegA family two-component response regulator